MPKIWRKVRPPNKNTNITDYLHHIAQLSIWWTPKTETISRQSEETNSNEIIKNTMRTEIESTFNGIRWIMARFIPKKNEIRDTEATRLFSIQLTEGHL